MVVSVSVQDALRIRYAIELMCLIPSLISLGTIRLDLAEADVEINFFTCKCRLNYAWLVAKSASGVLLRGKADLIFDRSDPDLTVTRLSPSALQIHREG